LSAASGRRHQQKVLEKQEGSGKMHAKLNSKCSKPKGALPTINKKKGEGPKTRKAKKAFDQPNRTKPTNKQTCEFSVKF